MLLVIGGLSAAEDAAPAVQRLSAERDRAAAAVQEARQTIEEERRQRIAAIDELQRRIRQRQEELTTALRRSEAARGERDRLQTAAADADDLAGRLARRLAGEGLAVDPRAGVGDLVDDWPAVVAAVDERLAGLDAALVAEQRQEEVLDRSGEPVTVPVWYWGAAQRVALGPTSASRGLLLRLDDGSWQVGGPYLADELLSDPARQVVDVTGRLAASEPQAGGPAALFRRAGPFAWPILLVALLGCGILLDRCWLLWRWHTPRSLVDRLIADREQPQASAGHLGQRQTPTARILREVLQHRSVGEAEREQRAGAALVEAEVRLGRGLRLLAVLAAAAPLLGLLGTVTGMITSFRALDLGGGGNAGQLSAGIGEALLTTEFGLIVAVPLLIAHAIFARDAQRRRAQAESAAMRLLAALRADESGSGDDDRRDAPTPPTSGGRPAAALEPNEASHA